MKIRTKITLSLIVLLCFLFISTSAIHRESLEIQNMQKKAISSRNLLLASTGFRAQVRNRLLKMYQVAYGGKPLAFLVADKTFVDLRLQDLKKSMEEERRIHHFINLYEKPLDYKITHLVASYMTLEKSITQAVQNKNVISTAELQTKIDRIVEVDFANFLKIITDIIDKESEEVKEENARTDLRIAYLRRGTVLNATGATFIALLMLIWITKSITIPLEKLEAATLDISAGNFELTILSKGSDEIAHLSKAFNKMIYALHQNKLEIEKQQQTIFESAKLNSLGDMARGVAHEINSPLAAMILGAELIERRNSKLIPPDEKIGKYAQSIMDAGARVDTIVKGLKGFSRNASEDQLTTFTARHLIDMTLNLCGEMLKANNIEIIVKDKFLDTVINGSETLFSQCLYNLISNAFDAVTKLETRWVQISINLSEDKIEIRITDSGSGITPEIRQKMFSPMFTTRPIGKGPGLGLNISRSIMNNFGGNIIYDESCTNTCFVMELPHSA